MFIVNRLPTGDEIWHKIEHLRDERRKINEKMTKSMKNGVGTDEVYKFTLRWFELVAFLDKDTEGRRTLDNLSTSAVRYMHIRVE